jgi:hypothetical protein
MAGEVFEVRWVIAIGSPLIGWMLRVEEGNGLWLRMFSQGRIMLIV